MNIEKITEPNTKPIINSVPAVPLRGGAVFPGTTTTISIGRRTSLSAAQAAAAGDGKVLILVQYDAEIEDPVENDVVPIGILARVRDVLRAPQIGVQMLVELQERVRFTGFVPNEDFLVANYEPVVEDDNRDQTQLAEAIAYLEQFAEILGEMNRQVMAALRSKGSAGSLADYLAGLLTLPFELELDLLRDLDGASRLAKVREHLEREIQIAEIRQHIQQDARESAEGAQREFLLREQMRSIRKELGEDDDSLADELEARIEDAGMPEEVHKRAISELRRMERIGNNNAESSVIRTYLEWLVEIPWNVLTEDNLDTEHVRNVLDEDHYGLEDVKDRIVEYVAVRKLAGPEMKGAIINLNGPPGVGKTSIATSVARAMGRKMIRISLGGVRDEAEIRGHRRTYIGALPGRIIRALRDAETRNPVIVLDEIDKVGSDWRGDPSSALLEVLDPEQNSNFTDHYLEVPVDLSRVIFITTSNTTSTIPAPLFDRMESINMMGYIEDEKLEIARGYLIGKQQEANGVGGIEINFPEESLRQVIRHYTYEAGVRQLERTLGTLVRKLAVQVAGGSEGPFDVTSEMVTEHLGPEKFDYGRAEERDEVGVVTGMAVNSMGGDVLTIEVSLMEGSGKITLTGSLGEVMQESAQAALTYARSNARHLGLDPTVFDRMNIHIHVPAGATPKDGPSAGVAMATAVISALTRRPVRRDVAMTGEVTLRGKVLQIGGVKAKAIAAHRAGIKTVLLPKDNAKDLPELPEQIRKELNLIPVGHLDEVLPIALLEAIGPPFTVERTETPPATNGKPGKTGTAPMQASGTD